MAKNIHNGHRERMFERIAKHGCGSLSEHELIEVMLFYAIPRINTNDIAHELLTMFGSVKGILDADVEELVMIKGIGYKSAYLIKMMPELLKRYLTDQSHGKTRYDVIGKIAEKMYPCFIGSNQEKLYMMMFNNRLNLLDCVLLSTGVVNCSEVMMRKLSEYIIYKGAAAVAFAHNHPEGLACPSQTDKEVTEILRIHVENLGVQMIDHLVFADQRYVSIMKKEYGKCRVSPLSQKIDVSFYDKFYEGSETDEYCVIPAFPGIKPES